jgi:hypothetical protein
MGKGKQGGELDMEDKKDKIEELPEMSKEERLKSGKIFIPEAIEELPEE